MRYDLNLIQQVSYEAGLISQLREESVDIELRPGVILSFQNSEIEQDCLVGFQDTPWHTHDEFLFADPRGHYIEMDYLDVLVGLAKGTVLICEKYTNGKLVDRRLIHKDYSDELDSLEESDQIVVWRAIRSAKGDAH